MSSREPSPGDRPLDGIRIVDLSRVLAGPFCTLLLAQLGARVIKVESPRGGDDGRAIGPFKNGKSLYFSSVNWDKESIAIDLKTDEGRALLLELLEHADVLVENYRPGTMERLGLDWPMLHERFPRLVVGSLSGFGQTGPLARRPAYDMVVQGMGGVMSVTGHPGGPPTRVGVSIGDITAGLYLSTGVVAALLERERTGVGSRIDVAMLDCQVAILEGAITVHGATGEVAGPLGDRHPRIAPFGVFDAADGPIVIAAGNDRLFALLCKAIGREELPRDPRFDTPERRRAAADELRRDLETTLGTRTAAEWLDRLEAAGIPCSPVNDVAEVAALPQVAARGMILEVEDPALGRLRVAGNPIKITGRTEPADHRPPPALDADREAILAELRNRNRR